MILKGVMYTMPEEDLKDLSFKQTDVIEMHTHMFNKFEFRTSYYIKNLALKLSN
jgi:hypothetical protein